MVASYLTSYTSVSNRHFNLLPFWFQLNAMQCKLDPHSQDVPAAPKPPAMCGDFRIQGHCGTAITDLCGVDSLDKGWGWHPVSFKSSQAQCLFSRNLVYALYNRSRRVRHFLCIVFLVNFSMEIWGVSHVVRVVIQANSCFSNTIPSSALVIFGYYCIIFQMHIW